MKLFLSATLLFTIGSCTQQPSAKPDLKLTATAVTDNKDIFGAWSMCTTSDRHSTTQMNVCETIVFNNDGTGYVEKNASQEEKFTWSLKKLGMKIIPSSKNEGAFIDTFYFANFYKGEDFFDLTLVHNDQQFFLNKPVQKK